MTTTGAGIEIDSLGVDYAKCGEIPVTELIPVGVVDTVEHLVMTVSTITVDVSGLVTSLYSDTDINDSPVVQEYVCPEHRRRDDLSAYVDTQLLVKNCRRKMTVCCFGLCGMTDRLNRLELGWCWDCVDRLVWGYRVSCLVAIVTKNRLSQPFLTEQNPAEMVGETVIDCRPSLLPVSIPLSGLSPETISGARSCVNYQPSEETGQSIMNTNEITINQIIGFEWDEAGTDVEDEMPTPVSSPSQIAVPAIPPAGTADPFGRGDGFDMELAKVMCDVSVLPSLVSPLQEVEVPPYANAADYAAPAAPALETVLESPGYTVPEELGCSWMPEFVPVSEVVSADEGGYLRSLQEPLPPQAATSPIAPMVADITPQTVPLNSCETVTAPVTKGSPSSAKCVVTNDVGPDLSREGPFDACDAIHEPGHSPMVLDSMSGWQYRMTSYEDRTNRDDLDPSYGIHLHDPRMMEYMGAPESARLLGRTPEYWLEHMGRERTVQAALRLHHDASLIMTNVQIMSQLVTSFSRTASEVMRTVYDREPFPTSAVDFVKPGRRV